MPEADGTSGHKGVQMLSQRALKPWTTTHHQSIITYDPRELHLMDPRDIHLDRVRSLGQLRAPNNNFGNSAQGQGRLGDQYMPGEGV
jgi:hypothetical protein